MKGHELEPLSKEEVLERLERGLPLYGISDDFIKACNESVLPMLTVDPDTEEVECTVIAASINGMNSESSLDGVPEGLTLKLDWSDGSGATVDYKVSKVVRNPHQASRPSGGQFKLLF